MSESGSPLVLMLSRGCKLMLLRSTLSMSATMLVTTAWSNSAGRAIWKDMKTFSTSRQSAPQSLLLLWKCRTCARCKNEVCLFRDETKCRAIGSFLAARHSGRFSKEEASQCSQCLAKLRISANRLVNSDWSVLLDWDHIYQSVQCASLARTLCNNFGEFVDICWCRSWSDTGLLHFLHFGFILVSVHSDGKVGLITDGNHKLGDNFSLLTVQHQWQGGCRCHKTPQRYKPFRHLLHRGWNQNIC